MGFRRFASRLGASYWFIPTVMAFLAVLLAGLMIFADTYEGSGWMDNVPWLYAARPSGARGLLSSIGGSMITVAGTVFSVTIAAVVYASGQYGPRLLTNFMKDRGNQVTLGTFIATFLYCLLVLRTVRSADEANGYSFVPNMALLVGVVLALCSIAVLIFFIHHVPSKIHINSVIKEIGTGLIHDIDHRFPRRIGRAMDVADGEEPVPAAFRRDAKPNDAANRRQIAIEHTGYIETIDSDDLLDLATDTDLVLRLQYQPGDFVHAGRTIVEAWPSERCDDAVARKIAATFSVSSARSSLQDLRFPIDELVEIAARALSPGITDPFTALTCLDWLGAALSDLAGRDLPSHLRVDAEDRLRVIAHAETFQSYADRAFGALVQYCAADMVAALRYLGALGEVAINCDDPTRLAILTRYADRLEELAVGAMSGYNLSRVRERADDLRRALAEPDYKRRLRDGTAWLGGTA